MNKFLHTILLGFLTLALPLGAAAQNLNISGTVLDDKNEPVVGATVIVKGTTIGTTTGINGDYNIATSPDATLVFSLLGMTPREEPVSGRGRIDVQMSNDATELEEVVAIGYGNQRKEDLSMAVSTIKVDDVVKGRPSDIGTVLQGRVPGVTVLKNGDPMKATAFSIRGRGSKGNDNDITSANGVLFVVDGVPNAPFAVDDVETITVLKDAASASIYGAQVGASGVVIITTKKAKAGKAKVDFNVSIGFQKVSNLPELLTAEEYNTVWAKAVANSTSGILPSAADPVLYPWGNVTRTDWLDEIFQTGKVQHYAVTVSGGNEMYQSLFSLAYDKLEGTLLNTWNEGITARLNNDFKITDWLKLSEKITFSYSDGQGNVDTGHEGPIMGAVWYPRSASVYEMNEDGSYALDAKGEKFFGGTSPQWASVSGYPSIYNPVAALEKMHRRYPNLKMFSTTGLEVKPMSDITFKSDFTVDLNLRDVDEFYPKMTETGLIRADNFREEFHYKTYHYLWENVITYSHVFADKHHVSAMAGFMADYNSYQQKGIFTQEYPSEDQYGFTYDGAKWSTSRAPLEEMMEKSMVSFVGRVGYSYDDRYFLVASIRRDASSKLPKAHQYDVFPAFSGSWKVSSEKFFQNLGLKNIVNLFKIRAGWGKTGNVDLYPTNAMDVLLLSHTYQAIFGQNLDNQVAGTYLNTIPNANAKWEITEQTSIGTDIVLLNRSLEIGIDYYDKRTKQLIDRIPTPQQIGVNDAPMGNMGEVINKGWEFSANYHSKIGELGYGVWGMFNFNDGYVENYGNRNDPISHSSPNLNSQTLLYSSAGQPWHSFMIYQTAGIFQSEDEVAKYVSKNPETGQTSIIMPNAKPGDVRFVDANGDGVINEKDLVFAGSYDPKRTFSFGASLDFKGFDFNIMFQGVAGNHVYNGLRQMAMTGRQSGGNLLKTALDTWDFNPNSKWPRLGLVEDNNYNKFSDLFLERGDYLRLKNITVGYTLPTSLLNAIGLKKSTLRVYISADNLLTFTDYTGIDPEVGNYGIDRGVYPISRFVNFGVNVNF
jgi:TonB-linked SusC/RagA family outer membrane protein